MSRGRALVLILVVFLLLVVVGSAVAIFTMLKDGGAGGKVAKGSVLVLNIGGSLPEQPAPEAPFAGMEGAGTSMLELDSALRKAAVDKRIERVLVRPGGLGTGYAKVQELRAAMRRFSEESGKPIDCWMEAAGNKEYLLATGCDKIYMAPEGLLLVNGLDMGVTFYKGTLDKIGVKADFARAGKYKSALEPMTSTSMSPAFREMMEALADDLYGDFVDAIATSRSLSPERVRALIDDPPFTASAAVRAGMIDGLFYRDQLIRYLAGEDVEPIAAVAPTLAPTLWDAPFADAVPEGAVATPVDEVAGTGGDGVAEVSSDKADDDSASGAPDDDDSAGPGQVHEPELDQVSLAEYRKTSPSSLGLGKGPKIAVVFCEGQITSGRSNPGGGLSSKSMGSDTIAAAVRKARRDDAIKAIVLRIDSPGGSGLASDVIWREVELARRVKPVVVSMSDYAASGGYYIAMAADAIVAEPGTLTGSIGVFGGKYTLSGLYEKLGMTTERIKRGEMADLFSSTRPLGDTGRAKLEEYIDSFYETFIRKAGAGRGVSPMAIHEVAQGRVWTGKAALQVGLVDELGTFRTALKLAKEKAGIEGEVSLTLLPRQPSFWEQLLESQAAPGLGGSLSLDQTLLRGQPGVEAAWDGLSRFLGAAPLFASGQPVLMPPYHIEAR